MRYSPVATFSKQTVSPLLTGSLAEKKDGDVVAATGGGETDVEEDDGGNEVPLLPLSCDMAC